jgi:DNA repair protein RAD50
MEQHAKEDKDKGDRVTSLASSLRLCNSRQAEKKVPSCRMRLKPSLRQKQLGTEVSQISAKAEEAWKQVAHYDHIVAKLNGKRIEARALKKNMEGFREHIKEMSESDEWLQSTLDQYEERTALHVRHKEGQTKKYEELNGRSTVTGTN